MGKNKLKRAAAKHSQNVADMFKRRKSSLVTVLSSPVSTSAVTVSLNPVSTSAVTVSSSPVSGTKNRGFDKHFYSDSHKEAHERLVTIPEACSDISSQVSTAYNNEKSTNRQNLLKILSNVRFLARQALPLRGHRSGKDSNFMQLYILREEDNDGLKTWRTEKKTDKYVHSTIQNEMMKLMALRILRDVARNIRDSNFYSMMCDEATDVGNVSTCCVSSMG